MSTLKKLGKYEILGEQGRGAMGVVYKGRDPFIGRMVAIKTITTGLSENQDLLQRFYREAQAAGGLQHPNIVTIYDAGEESGTPYIAMEFLDGEDLANVVTREVAGQAQVPPAVKIGYIVRVCQALDYAHRRNIVHRDIKPGNIFITSDGTVKVVDFGIARLTNTSSTSSGMLIGTIDYMSPEQIRGEKVDGRSDIWAVGVMSYEILAHQKPFQGSNITAVMFSIVSQEPKALRELRPDLPAELETILKKMLRKDTNERYQSMDDLLSDLEPVWKRMQQDNVSNLVTEGESLFKSGNFQRARDVLKQVLVIDTGHSHAKTLLDKISAEIRRSEVVPKLKEIVANGQRLMQAGKFDEARVEIENALKIDSAYQPARELLSAVQKAAERNQAVQAGLRTTRQRMAEGSLTEAEQSVTQVLSLAPDDPEAQSLRRQIQEEKDRRGKRKQISDAMQRARQLWTAQQFEDSAKLLEDLARHFPGETEIVKLLETVRVDQAQQEVQLALTKARRHLGGQEFSEALSVLDTLLERYPQETAAQKLREQVLIERKEHANRLRLQRELQGLKKLVSEEKYQDAINVGEGLLKEFPDEFELARMVDYARSQKSQQHLQLRKQTRLKDLHELIQANNFDKAIAACEEALKEFAGDAEFLRLLELSRSQQKEQKDRERRQLIEQRLRNIKQSIERGELTDAIDLGKRTLVQVGPDSELTKMVEMAQHERASRDEKRVVDEEVQSAITMLESKKFAAASQVLRKVDESGVFDPRVPFLLKAAQEERVPTKEDLTLVLSRPMIPSVGSAPPGGVPTGAGVGGETRVAVGQNAAVDSEATQKWTEPLVPADVDATAKFQAPPEPRSPASATEFNATSVMPAAPADVDKGAPSIAPAPPPESGKKKKKGKKGEGWRPQAWRGEKFLQETEEPKQATPAPRPAQGSATSFMPAPMVEETVKQPPKPRIEPPAPAPPPEGRKVPREERTEPAPAPAYVPEEVPREAKPFLKSGAGMAVMGVALAAVIGIGIFLMRPSAPAVPGTTVSNPSGNAGGTTTNLPESSGGGTSTTVNPVGGGSVIPSPADDVKKLILSAKKMLGKGNADGATSDLDKAAKLVADNKLGGNFSGQIAGMRKSITDVKANAALAKLLSQEADLWDNAEKALSANQFDQAAAAYNQILGLGEGGIHKTDAQTELARIAVYKQEESLFPQAQAAAQKRGTVEEIDAAVQKLNEVAGLHGRREAQARQLLGELAPARQSLAASNVAAAAAATAAAEKSARIKALNNDFRAAINSKDVPAAQQKVAALQREGENVSALNDDISKLAESLRAKATCQVLQMGHDDHVPLFKKGDNMAQMYLDKPAALTPQPNCGLPTDVTQSLAKGTKVQLQVDIDENGTVTGGRVPGGGALGAQVLQNAQRTWRFNSPTVHGTPVKSTVGVLVMIN